MSPTPACSNLLYNDISFIGHFFCDVILDATRNYFYISHIDILRALFSHEKYELLFLFHPWVYELYLI